MCWALLILIVVGILYYLGSPCFRYHSLDTRSLEGEEEIIGCKCCEKEDESKLNLTKRGEEDE